MAGVAPAFLLERIELLKAALESAADGDDAASKWAAALARLRMLRDAPEMVGGWNRLRVAAGERFEDAVSVVTDAVINFDPDLPTAPSVRVVREDTTEARRHALSLVRLIRKHPHLRTALTDSGPGSPGVCVEDVLERFAALAWQRAAEAQELRRQPRDTARRAFCRMLQTALIDSISRPVDGFVAATATALFNEVVTADCVKKDRQRRRQPRQGIVLPISIASDSPPLSPATDLAVKRDERVGEVQAA